MSVTKFIFANILLTLSLFANDAAQASLDFEVTKTELNTLSIQNISNERVEIEILGNITSLKPDEGFLYQCSKNETFIVGFKAKVQKFMDLDCQTNVHIRELYSIRSEGV